MIRRGSLRIIGFAVAAICLVVATQLLLLSFEATPLLSRRTVDSLTRWLLDRPKAGPGILGGAALVGLSVWLAWSFLRSFGTDRRVITTRSKDGWTKLDRASLEHAIERRLEEVDRRNDVEVRITRRGRIDAAVATPDPSAAGPARELRDVIDDICIDRDLPCRSGQITTTVPRSTAGRRRVR